jgi:hypothetical protein
MEVARKLHFALLRTRGSCDLVATPFMHISGCRAAFLTHFRFFSAAVSATLHPNLNRLWAPAPTTAPESRTRSCGHHRAFQPPSLPRTQSAPHSATSCPRALKQSQGAPNRAAAPQNKPIAQQRWSLPFYRLPFPIQPLSSHSHSFAAHRLSAFQPDLLARAAAENPAFQPSACRCSLIDPCIPAHSLPVQLV